MNFIFKLILNNQENKSTASEEAAFSSCSGAIQLDTNHSWGVQDAYRLTL